jgi:hypothetical protein
MAPETQKNNLSQTSLVNHNQIISVNIFLCSILNNRGQMDKIVGIDPGKSGAVCVFSPILESDEIVGYCVEDFLCLRPRLLGLPAQRLAATSIADFVYKYFGVVNNCYIERPFGSSNMMTYHYQSYHVGYLDSLLINLGLTTEFLDASQIKKMVRISGKKANHRQPKEMVSLWVYNHVIFNQPLPKAKYMREALFDAVAIGVTGYRLHLGLIENAESSIKPKRKNKRKNNTQNQKDILLSEEYSNTPRAILDDF